MTEEEAIKLAEHHYEAVAEGLKDKVVSAEVLLLASIACSNIAIYKASR
jgi:hypothetical protein